MIALLNILLLCLSLSIISLIILIHFNDSKFGIISLILLIPVIIFSLFDNICINTQLNEIKGKNEIISCNNIFNFNKKEINIADLDLLFKNSIKYGYCIRINKLNGLDKWNELKSELSKLKLYKDKIQWNFNKDTIEKLYKYVHNNLQMKGDDIDKVSNSDHILWEKYHFFLQLVRIPKLNYDNPNFILRVCQIGYNIGQMNAIKKLEPYFYSKESLQWLEENRLLTIDGFIKIVN